MLILKTHTQDSILFIRYVDSEKLEVYKKAKRYNSQVKKILQKVTLDKNEYNQLKRASFSIMLNIAEGTGRLTNRDKRNFYVISRGSVFECVAIFDYLHEENVIDNQVFKDFYRQLEEISKMLFALIKGLS